ncbi:P-loop containing nucleoside triphosphate hydrolase protein [Ganoderma leucocontextum]|nr:P-loop containing nucleoside triphosphate hydrolase protein [Ganoderma leucocontextum]
MKTDEMERLIDSVCQELYQSPRTIREVYRLGEEVFTTGEPYMDEALGGGIRTGMLWEIAGEKNAGKTQLALQLCLTVQLPPNEGGLYGAAYYISTRDEPQVSERLRQMIERHPRLSQHSCTLPPHCTISTFPAFRDALRKSIPKYAEELCASTPGRKRLKLVIVDAISDLFDANKVPEYEDTKWRARHLRLTSSLLHQLATDFHVAVIVLGGTRGTFPRKDGEDKSPGELRYSDQERWFARGYSLDGEDANEAILGHVWPNQLNARIMMSRTARERPRHALDPKARKLRVPEPASKRRRLDPDAPHQQSTCEDAEDERLPLRRFSVLFSSAGHAASCDYAILDGGVIAFPPEERPQSTPEEWPATLPPTAGDPSLMYHGSLSTSSAEPGASRSHWYQQSLSYVTDPGRQVTPPPTGQGMLVDDEDDEEAYWRHFN